MLPVDDPVCMKWKSGVQGDPDNYGLVLLNIICRESVDRIKSNSIQPEAMQYVIPLLLTACFC